MRPLPIGRRAGVPGRRHFERSARLDPGNPTARDDLVSDARWGLYATPAIVLALFAGVGAVLWLLLGPFALLVLIPFAVGASQAWREDRRETLDALSPAARELTRLRR